ncbi:Aspartic proteinase nepenthesin-1 precursor, putative [Ricinus communis]|uniref:Aspartic proteinase nepenthesin-1, putative n=1 Tax=Ricinus communis TaxID=3988 RepID=B9R734_RICCO|nr:Aspartic proteinase nepenthesin-1 precursor, putative [Ricinus communis]|eukprot:XP_002510127.1 aspartic proteinase-like protein 2 [Ricinus communis]
MYPPSRSLIVIYYPLILFFLDTVVVLSATDIPNHNHRPMIIPLHLSTSNISSHRKPFTSNYHRRQLHNSDLPNAHMRLYDDLLSNGYYTTRLFIGTPPQEFALIVDTGSTVTYVPCSTCEQCGKHQDPRFQPESSSTYKPMQCNPSCNCDDEGKQCTYERRYAEMSSSSGLLAEDVLSFGNESELTPQRAIFGCETVETGELFSQRADGIMGLGRGPLSVVDQLVIKEVVGNSFSLCYGGMDVVGGAMVLGNIPPPPDMVFAHSDPYRSAYYNIELKELHVAGKRLKLNPRVFDGKHGTVLDSGTTYAYLPEEAFVAFKDAIIKEIKFLKQIHGPDPSYNDICFSGAGRDVSQLSKIFPEVNMVFGNGQKLSLSPENYLFRHTKVSGAYCLGIFQNGKDPTTLLGGIVVRNTLVTYDRDNDKIGFWKTNCSELWKRLQSQSPGIPAPPPVVFSSGNKSESIAPTQAPSGLPPDFIPGEFRIGVITFDMLMNINNSAAKPNLTEVAEFIAHELQVDNLQVHMLNFTSQGNNYLVKWGIFPAESADYISNTTAMNIILQLRDHRLQFPERFGSYQLVEWRIQPQRRPTWWHEHFFAVVAGVVTILLVSLLSIGIWTVWRHRQRALGTYEPVGGIVPEQELQPL